MNYIYSEIYSMTQTLRVTTHPDYPDAADDIKTIRDGIEGSQCVKRAGYRYLPHPSQIDKDSKEQQIRYLEFLGGAEYDGFPDDTRRELLGKMRISNTNFEFNDRLEYIIQNADGDGMPLNASIEYAVNNVLQTKWHVLVVDTKNAPVGDAKLSKAERAQLKTRTNIKQYTRENVVNWNFSTVNDVMQLSYIELLQVSSDFDASSGTHDRVETYLIMALDENGDYYQQVKTFGGKTGEATTTEPDYPKIKGKPLKWLPVVILADEELPPYKMPNQLGYLSQIVTAALHRYRVSANYKEVQRNIAPTIMNSGWKDGDMDIFKEANNQRSYIATGAGAVNNMPEGVTSEVLSCAAEMSDFQWYFEYNEKKIRSMGGDANTQGVTMTATEADITASKQNALLNTIADNADQGFQRAVAYCGMFEGLYSPDDIESSLDDIVIELPRDFATPKLTDAEVQEYRQDYINGLITQEQYIKIMIKGGRRDGDIDEILAELEEAPPTGQPVDNNGQLNDNQN
mgnify:CR=1 FL=1